MKFKNFFAWCLLPVAFMVAIVACSQPSDRIVVGTKNFTEQLVLGEVLAQQIENKTNLKVDRRFNLNGTFICHEGIKSGELDLYPEYTGTAYTAILKKPAIGDAQKVFEAVRQDYPQQFKLEWLAPFGFSNSFAMIIRGDDAQKFNVQTLSEASKYTPQWRAGFGFEFLNREDGFPGLAQAYNLKFKEQPKVMDLGLLYKALTEKQVDLVAGNSTDGLIPTLNLVVLKDDKQFFPPYEAATIVRQETLQKHPELRPAIEGLAGKLTEETMQQLNYRVDGKKEDVKQVVREFLQSKSL
ncbi:MAG: ABC transporter substrate-binding protein [Leptolyngbyaceae cyanobacterium CSU_1_3]|nr:ABC transporter substrate-binding protein [Leptolyngbyaceae cyanobacterium CSU_1_3]